MTPDFDLESGIPAGSYELVITDAKGCQTPADNFDINDPPELTVSLDGNNISCHEGSDGSISPEVVGG